MTIPRTLVAALAIAAIAAPAAQAQPADIHAPLGETAPQVQNSQDLRSPDARDAAAPRPKLAIMAPGATAVDSATTRGPAQPVTPTVTDDGNGVNYAAIGVGLAGSLLAITGIVTLAGRRTRRLQRQRLAA